MRRVCDSGQRGRPGPDGTDAIRSGRLRARRDKRRAVRDNRGGQPGGIGRGAGGAFYNYAGYLGAILIQPDLDSDADGLCDETDPDNDGDGADDFGELIANTDPTNANSVLRFTSIGPNGGGIRLDWQGGTSAWQFVMRKQDLTASTEPWVAVFTNEAPTDVMEHTIDATATNGMYFYHIRAWRP